MEYRNCTFDRYKLIQFYDRIKFFLHLKSSVVKIQFILHMCSQTQKPSSSQNKEFFQTYLAKILILFTCPELKKQAE